VGPGAEGAWYFSWKRVLRSG